MPIGYVPSTRGYLFGVLLPKEVAHPTSESFGKIVRGSNRFRLLESRRNAKRSVSDLVDERVAVRSPDSGVCDTVDQERD